ncbi:MAG: hypothetical protein LLF76_08975 [Planctomycetaceae bacterium]|nr:hypothetical protein [Planctomycetaceae bacterium]
MKSQLLLLDANIVIYLCEEGFWNLFIQECCVTLTRTVVEEVLSYDLGPDIREGRIQCIEVPLATIQKFTSKYGPVYLDRLDAGETESLAFLMDSREKWFFSSADEIVFKVLGREGRSEQGISLEEILGKIGLTLPDLKRHYTKAFRENVTRKGQIDSITDFGHSL